MDVAGPLFDLSSKKGGALMNVWVDGTASGGQVARNSSECIYVLDCLVCEVVRELVKGGGAI